MAQRKLTQPETEFPIGSYVLKDYPSTGLKRRGHPRGKLFPPKYGPMRVINKVGTKYSVQDLVTGKVEEVPIHRLSTFLIDEDKDDPRETALRDNNEFVVEKILAHTGNKKRSKELKFEVKWLGYEESTWESWKSVRLVDKLHDYLRANGMTKLVPK